MVLAKLSEVLASTQTKNQSLFQELEV